ncbi:MAG: nucleotide exchange factor GrpE [Holosporales bacterium]|jgi:molecular chaperone GrpE (heat shock protein)|nr:nucleotide exchange factor GrpE [Holosporales bacterium]
MDTNISQLEDLIKNHLSAISNLANQIEQKELEKHDLLKETALGIIDIIDSFERLEEEIIEKRRNKSKDVSKIMKRYQTIHAKLIYLLQKKGITKIEFPNNRLIVGLCEITSTEPDLSKENDEIISIVKNGYVKDNELIRAAQIIVVKN